VAPSLHNIDAPATGPGAAAHIRAARPVPVGTGPVPHGEGTPVDQSGPHDMDFHQLVGLAPLDPGAVEVYEHASRAVSIGLPELVRLTGRTEGDIARSIRVLLRLRLLRPAHDDPTRLTAVSPDSAELHVLQPAVRKVAELQESLARVRGELSALSGLYHDGVAHRLREELSTESVTGAAQVRAWVDGLISHAAGDILLAHPGGMTRNGPWEPSEQVDAALARGVGVRTLYQHTAQFNAATVARIQQLTDLGAQARTLGDRFGEVVVVDGSVAVIPLRGDPHGVLIVRDPSTVDFIVGTFERLWTQATVFPARMGRRQAIAASDAMKSDIVRLLIAGEDDKAIARRMGMSVRTCQRHINEIMKRLGARSRARAGYLLHQYELQHPWDGPAGADPPGPGRATGG
jgi:hypothetical protein